MPLVGAHRDTLAAASRSLCWSMARTGLSVATVEYPMAIQPNVYVSPQEYLALERQAAYKSEYIAGTIVAMSGASREHNLGASMR